MIVHARHLLSPKPPAPVRGKRMMEVEELFDVDVVIDETSGKIVDLRPHKSSDLEAKLVTPGFFDAHTHVPFLGSRAFEFLLRAKGSRYIDILKAGGGIHHTASAVQRATEEELLRAGERQLANLVRFGVVGVECKSGYGLTPEAELKQLRVIKTLRESSKLKVVSTFLALHAKPSSRQECDDYCGKMTELLEKVKEQGLATFVDIFCDEGAFSPKEARAFAERAIELGFKLRLHADEISNVGATFLAVELGASSADHCLKIGAAEVAALANSSTIVTLMPGTSFYLGENYAPARELIDAGVAVALASDFNPGSCPIFQPAFVMHLALRYLRMELPEVLAAYTINSAHLLGFESGAIHPGFDADLVLWGTEDLADVPYMFQENFVEHVVISGRFVV